LFSNADSLRSIIKQSKNDSLKIMAYTSLVQLNYSKPSKALELLYEMIRFNERVIPTHLKALGLRKIGIHYSNLNYYDRALEFTFKAAELFEKMNDKPGLANCYNNIGSYYQDKGEFTQDKQFYNRSIEYHLKAIELRLNSADSIQVHNSYNNIGSTYRSLNEYDKALEYFNKAHVVCLKRNDQNGLDMIQNNLGECYLQLGIQKNDPAYLRKALPFFISITKNYTGINPNERMGSSFVSLGQTYMLLGNKDLGRSYLEKGLAISKEINDKGLIMNAAKNLADAYESKGDHANALEMLHLHNINKDSLINEKNSSSTEEMQVLYQSSQKDREIEKLNNEKIVKDAELSRQRTIIISSIGAALSILILVLVLWSRFNLKKKANEQLGDAYRKIELKNQQITDSINYSKRIQTAILPPSDLLNKHLQNFFIYYAPKDIVSGDFYWFSEHKNHLFFIVVDCTGHGVPGALMSMIGNTLLNEIINQKNITEPGDILNHLNIGVKHALRQSSSDMISQDDGMDVSICCVDRSNPRVLKYATANHSIFVKAKGAVTELVGDIYSIGGDFGTVEKSFENKTHTLEPDSFIVMSTDGYYDQFGGEKDSKFLVSRFEDLILNTDLQSGNCAEQFEKAIIQWRGLQKQTDDILVAGFKI
jgi:serine phosphatase RsbU (regulator of sigma subunit)